MRKIIAASAAAVLLTMVAPAASAGDPAHVQAIGFKFVPPLTVVEPGQAIEWTNDEPLDITHNVIQLAYFPASGAPVIGTAEICGAFRPGASCRRNGAKDAKRLTPGTYVYTCTVDALHTASMQGVLVVG